MLFFAHRCKKRESDPQSPSHSLTGDSDQRRGARWARAMPTAVGLGRLPSGRSSPISSNGGNGRSMRLYYSTSCRRCQLFLVIFGIIYRGNFSRFFDKAKAHPAEIRRAVADTVEPQPFLAGGVSDSGALPCSAVSAGVAGLVTAGSDSTGAGSVSVSAG
jgi:hypothetical protein